MSDDVFDVIVVGCGPVGAAAANLLGARGLRTLVLERDAEPYALPRAIHFDHEIMRIFQSAGMAAAIEPHTFSPAGRMFFGANRRPIRRFEPNERTPRLGWPSGLYFYQPDLERVLREELARRPSVTIALQCEVLAVEQQAGLVTVLGQGLEGAFRYPGRFVLGCDGARSVVRKAIGVALDDLEFDEPWIVVDGFVDGPITLPELHGVPEGIDMQDVLFIIGDPVRPLSIIPGTGRHRRFEFMMLPSETAADYAGTEAVSALVAPFVQDASFELIRSAIYRFHALVAQKWRRGRVFLAGDSAHQTPPYFGQGLCHGIRDAANLVWKLDMVLRGGAPETLLATYQLEREPQVRAVIEMAVRAGRSLCTLDPAGAARRDAEFAAQAVKPATAYVDLIPPLREGLLEAPSGAPAPAPLGARFIQPPMLDRTGAVRLLDDCTGGGFVLLVRAGHGATTGRLDLVGAESLTVVEIVPAGILPRDEALEDTSGELVAWLDQYECDSVLVRPDFYVYGVGRGAAGVAALATQLRRDLSDERIWVEPDAACGMPGIADQPKDPSEDN